MEIHPDIVVNTKSILVLDQFIQYLQDPTDSSSWLFRSADMFQLAVHYDLIELIKSSITHLLKKSPSTLETNGMLSIILDAHEKYHLELRDLWEEVERSVPLNVEFVGSSGER